MKYQMFKLVLEMAEEPEIKMTTSAGSSKTKEFQKTPISILLTMPKPLTVSITINWKILREMGIPDHLTSLLRNLYEKLLQVKKQQLEPDMEQQTGFK